MMDQPEMLADALERFWRVRGKGVFIDNAPDYGGLIAWYLEKADAETRAYNNSPYPEVKTNLIVQLRTELKRHGIRIENGKAKNDNQFLKKTNTLKEGNKIKMLYVLIDNLSPRITGLLEVLDRSPSIISCASLPASIGPSAFRAALFEAIEVGEYSTAQKILGRLREEDHDAGELQYLEGLVEFKSRNFQLAIQSLSQVDRKSVDGSKAFFLLLESYASLGDLASMMRVSPADPNEKWPAYFWPFLYQKVLMNSSSPEELLPIIAQDGLLRTENDTDVFRHWNRFSCSLAVEYAEHFDGIMLTRAESDAQFQENETTSLRFRQLRCALFCDPDFSTELLDFDRSKWRAAISHRLMHVGDPSPQDYILTMMALYRLCDYDGFFHNVKESISNITRYYNVGGIKEALEVLKVAYTEAVIRGDRKLAGVIRDSLVDNQEFMSSLERLEVKSSSEALLRELSTMGKMALVSAREDLASAENERNPWRDCGMISLGFFRVLELEINARIIKPLLLSLNVEELEREVERLRRVEGKSAQSLALWWSKMFEALAKGKRTGRGLELGAIELLLGRARFDSGADQLLKKCIREAILDFLTPAGREIFLSGDLAAVVREDVREKYRNPAAHTRFTTLQTARECRVYVETTLSALLLWTQRASRPDGTLH